MSSVMMMFISCMLPVSHNDCNDLMLMFISCMPPVSHNDSLDRDLLWLQPFTEKGYDHMTVSTHTVSYWTWVGMVNSVGLTFYNELYDSTLQSRCAVRLFAGCVCMVYTLYLFTVLWELILWLYIIVLPDVAYGCYSYNYITVVVCPHTQ